MMRILVLFIFLFPVLKTSANDSISVWTMQMNNSFKNQKYTEARVVIDKMIKVWEEENNEIDDTYLYLLFYKQTCLFIENRHEEAEKLIDKILNNIYLIDENKDSELYSLLLSNKAAILEEKGTDVSILIPMLEKALEIDTKLYGRRDKRNITTLQTLAIYNEKLGNYYTAIQYEKEAVSISRTFLDKYDSNLATSLLLLSHYYYTTGSYHQALELRLEGADIYKHTLGEDYIGYIKAISEIGMCYANLYDYKQALDYCKKALQLLEKYKNDNQGLYLNILGAIGICYSKMANYKEAIEIQQEEIELSANFDGTNSLNYATALSNLGSTFLSIEKYDTALKYTLDALKIRKQQKDSISWAHSLEGLSVIYCRMDNFPMGIKYAKEALEMYEKTIGKNHLKYTNCLSNLAACYLDNKNYDRALECEEEALKIMQNLYGFNYIDYAGFSLYNLSVIYHYLNDQDKAIEYGMQHLELIKKQRGTQNTAYASTLCAIAECYWYIGNISRAIALQEEAKEITEQVFGEDSEEYAIHIGNLANYYADQGNYNQAIKYVIDAIDIKKRIIGENHTGYLQSLTNLIAYYDKMHDYKNAIMVGNNTIKRMQEKCALYFLDLSSEGRTKFWDYAKRLFLDLYPKLNYYGNTNTPQFYNSVLFSKGILLNSEIEIAKLIAEDSNQIARSVYENLKLNKNTINKLYQLPSENRYMSIDSLRQVVEKQEEDLLGLVKSYGDYTKNLQINWSDVKNRLEDKGMAVEFVRIPINNDSTMYAALTLRKDYETPKMTILFEEKQLKSVSDTTYFNCKEMTDLVWQPLFSELESVKNVYFSPAGALYNIGIEYLPGMEDYNLYRLSSTRELVINIEQEQTNNAVLYGGLDYYAKLDTTKVTDDSFLDDIFIYHADVRGMNLRGSMGALPQTKVEVEQIGEELNKAKWAYQVFTDEKGTEESFKSLSGKKIRNLHISTHGFYYTKEDADNLGYDFLQLMGNHTSSEDKSLTRSGLIMAGANHILEGEDLPDNAEDGILTAKEIADVDLRGLDLVVLSACQTGLGDIAQGEGVFGLQRGFKKAGANSILMSLWEVNDEATQILMTQFYKNLLSGQSKYKSLQSAQKYLREYDNRRYDVPKYWAAFILLDGIDS